MQIGARRKPAYLEIASKQFGIVGREDLKRDGLSASALWRRTQSGQLEELRPGAFRLPGSTPGWKQDLMALQVWAGPNSRISHRAAARLWKLDGFDEEILEITTTRRIKPNDDAVVHRVPHLNCHDRALIGNIVATTPARTLLDLGAVADIDLVEDALECALRKRLTTIGALDWELKRGRGRGHRGARYLARLLSVRPRDHVPMASRLEIRIDRLLRVSPLPSYERQYTIQTRVGLRRPDFAFPTFKVAIEGDGYDSHGGRKAWIYDRQRDRALEALGWDVIHVTWDDIHQRRDEFIADLCAVLKRKGWNPPVQLSI